MRPYLGKTKEGKRVYGMPVKWDGKTYMYTDRHDTFMGRFVEVIPETVAQSTGLFNKNKKEIFGGDKVRFMVQFLNYIKPIECTGIVRYVPELAAYYVFFHDPQGHETSDLLHSIGVNALEIIHDKDLLEQGGAE